MSFLVSGPPFVVFVIFLLNIREPVAASQAC